VLVANVLQNDVGLPQRKLDFAQRNNGR